MTECTMNAIETDLPRTFSCRRRECSLSPVVLMVVCLALPLAFGSPLCATTITFDPAPTVSPSGGIIDPNNDNFTAGSYYVEGFWAVSVGTGTGDFTGGGHFHIDLDTGSTGNAELQHFNSDDHLQGIYIERIDGDPFSLQSLDYRVRDTSSSIDGFSSADAQVLVATSFDPTQTVASEFTAFSVGTDSPIFATLPVSGFNNVTGLFIASSADVSFDNINLSTVPEPGTFALLGLGLLGFVLRRRRLR